ncbi:MAG: DUF4363 family protein [Firmicutes bacterium]|nr:DUF4363 family protein [Bacillota bacterium]
MRLLVGLTVVVAVIIGFGCLVDQGVSSAVGEVLLVLNQGEHYIDEGDYTAGLELFRQADQQWKAVQGTWNPFVYNTDLEEVEAALARLISYTETNSFSHVKAELSHIRTRLKQIQIQERLTLRNIL